MASGLGPFCSLSKTITLNKEDQNSPSRRRARERIKKETYKKPRGAQ